MNRIVKQSLAVFVLAIWPAFTVLAGEFKPYPGATLDKKATEEANKSMGPDQSTCKLSVYLTPDAYDKAVQFYKGMGTEHPIFANVPKFKGQLPVGEELRKTAVILDGVSEVGDSSLWVQIQHPFILEVKMKGHTPEFLDVRDLTGITLIAGKCRG